MIVYIGPIQIQMSFLMVGHTHEDIDQVFSRVSAHLKKNSVYTLEGEYVVGMLAVCVLNYMDVSIEYMSV